MYDYDYINKRIGIPLDILDEIDSSNEEGKRRVQNGHNEDFLLIAREQTKGKGRKGRDFYSPKDTGIYLSFVHFSEADFKDDLKVTIASSVIVQRAVKNVMGKTCGIKWVNDLYLNGKKICGILCECMMKDSYFISQNALIVGIGINLSTNDFPTDIKKKAGSLIEENPEDIKDLGTKFKDHFIDDLVIDIVIGLKKFFENDDLKGYMKDYKDNSIVLGRHVELSDAKGIYAKGIVNDFCDDGSLLLLTDDSKEMIIDSGEISLIIN